MFSVQREVEAISGVVLYVNDAATVIKVKGLPAPLFRPKAAFSGERVPVAGETWRFDYDSCAQEDGKVKRFIIEQECEQEASTTAYKQMYPMFQAEEQSDPVRPNYEDGEWYFSIKDERGVIYRQTYESYLASAAWKRKRQARLTWDNNSCQARLPGCAARATECHHLSYQHLGNEPLWDLQSVCSACHEILTGMDNKGRKNKPGIS